ncbi:N-acetylmannosamine-6-phosphate 2-epimerase [Peribacillus muralis]|uniref:N-acetylmannosamine-6-phosphate 2-epimerase n=1 Tax=Peribacillus muralis TaxID=264697 RepID=UPI000710FE45|nr:N-acetylmannosamine-6-phosphate 2-epimerase [Peribacillus muralis]
MIEVLNGGLIVSCQALDSEPLHGSEYMATMAVAAQVGGAVGIRANGYSDIKRIKERVDLPIIGIHKKHYQGFDAFITPTKADAQLVAEAGADIIAIDATSQSRPEDLQDLIHFIKNNLNKILMADISTLEEGIKAESMGCDLISTTLAGYTKETQNTEDGPAFRLLNSLVKTLTVPVIAEGKIETPEDARKALEIGASFVVVGGAISRPQEITRRFVKGLNKYETSHRN